MANSRRFRSAMVWMVSLLIGTSVRGAEWEPTLNALKGHYAKAESLQFHTVVKTYRETDPSTKDPIVRVLDYKGKGAMFAFESKQTGGETALILGNGAYNGTTYQQRLGPQLRISKGLPVSIPDMSIADGFFTPFIPFKMLSEGDPTFPEAVMTLAQLNSSEQWDDVLRSAHETQMEGPPDDRYVVLTFSGFLENSEVNAKVWFSVRRGGYPMRWQTREVSREKSDPFGYDYE